MAEAVAPEFARFVADERLAGRFPAAPRPVAAGQVIDRAVVGAAQASELMRVAARRAAGLIRPSKRAEVVWVEGESELAIGLLELRLKLDAGLITVLIPVRCDQTGPAVVEVAFACGSSDQPAGLYAAAHRRPRGPELLVASWGDALVAFAWQCLLGLVTGIAGAVGKDQRGNVLVPVELTVTARGIQIVPMARHRFAGTCGLKPPAGGVER